MQGSRGQTHEELLAGTGQQVIRDRVLRQMTGLSVVKIKIYNLDGLTIFSTDERQVGEDRSGNEGFRQARDGLVASAIIYRDKFDAFEGTLSNRNLIYSYVPVRPAAGLAPEAVFEV